MARYLISFEYEGRDFFGSQKQPDKRTVQGELEKAICTLIKENKSTKIVMAGRLDRGVNAKFHTAHFECDLEIDRRKFLYSLNSLLPKDVSVFDVQKVEPRFHAQKSARFRHYRYTIRNSPIKPVFNKNVLWIRKPLKLELMRKALKNILGRHDFSAFKSNSDNPSDVCEIYFADIREEKINEHTEGCYLYIDIIGDRFLYNMVRAITGTLLMIENEDLEPSLMLQILNSKERANAGHNVEPYGLTLMKTGYEDPYDYINNTIKKGK